MSIAATLPGLGVDNLVVPSADAKRLFVFDGNGRHLRTLDAWTGSTQLEIGYDPENRVAELSHPEATSRWRRQCNVRCLSADASGAMGRDRERVRGDLRLWSEVP